MLNELKESRNFTDFVRNYWDIDTYIVESDFTIQEVSSRYVAIKRAIGMNEKDEKEVVALFAYMNREDEKENLDLLLNVFEIYQMPDNTPKR
jgi:hypothetical protein